MSSLAATIRRRLSALKHPHTQTQIDAVSLFRGAWGATPDPWQHEILHTESKRLFLNCARQSGKSTVTSVLAVKTALAIPRSLILILSPTDRQSGLLFRKCRTVYEANNLPTPPKLNERSMVLHNGSEIVSLPGKPDNIRGFSAPRLIIIDEAAFASDHLYRAVRPMLSVGRGTLALLSSPFGKRGFFHDEYRTIQDARQSGAPSPWHYIEVPASSVPRITPEFLAEERISLGPMFAQEYECQFLDSTVAMFSYEDIQQAIDGGEEIERWF